MERRENWIWGVGEEFGYVVVQPSQRGQDFTVISIRSTVPGRWLIAQNKQELENALEKRSRAIFPAYAAEMQVWENAFLQWQTFEQRGKRTKAPRRPSPPYRLYCASEYEAPMCFKNLMSWFWYLDSTESAKSVRSARMHCQDCQGSFQRKMIREDRCGHPEVDVEAAAVANEYDKPLKRSGRRKLAA